MWILWLFVFVFSCDSVMRLLHGTLNLGTLCMYAITAALWIYALFHAKIQAFCAYGIGFALKIVFFCGIGILCTLMLFLAIGSAACAPNGREKAMIVLGAGLRGDVPSGLLTRRMDAAYDYYTMHPDMIVVVSGGQGRFETIPEAVAMQKYLVNKGVPATQIITESKSTSTAENFLFSKELLAQKGIAATEELLFVTNAFHCYRAGKTAQHTGFSAMHALPASIGLSSILPCYMREAFALVHFWAFGP